MCSRISTDRSDVETSPSVQTKSKPVKSKMEYSIIPLVHSKVISPYSTICNWHYIGCCSFGSHTNPLNPPLISPEAQNFLSFSITLGRTDMAKCSSPPGKRRRKSYEIEIRKVPKVSDRRRFSCPILLANDSSYQAQFTNVRCVS